MKRLTSTFSSGPTNGTHSQLNEPFAPGFSASNPGLAATGTGVAEPVARHRAVVGRALCAALQLSLRLSQPTESTAVDQQYPPSVELREASQSRPSAVGCLDLLVRMEEWVPSTP